MGKEFTSAMEERFKKNYGAYIRSLSSLSYTARKLEIDRIEEHNKQKELQALGYKRRDYTTERVFVVDIHRWYAEGWTEAEIASILRLNIESVLDVLALPLTQAEKAQIKSSAAKSIIPPGLTRKWGGV